MINLPPLPYPYESLEPTVSSTTMHTHHDKHHAKYVEVANGLVAENGLEGKSVEELISHAEQNGLKKLFNNAAQAWNHAFFWDCMTPDYAAPTGDLARAIEAFGGLDALRQKFVEEGANHFASGWAWIGVEGGALKVLSTHDAGTLATSGPIPILVCDVWEHAYYLDYKQDRKSFLEKWFDTVANWAFAAERLAAGDQRWTYPQ
jgi:Fe-Mn family superoxide dismutase